MQASPLDRLSGSLINCSEGAGANNLRRQFVGHGYPVDQIFEAACGFLPLTTMRVRAAPGSDWDG